MSRYLPAIVATALTFVASNVLAQQPSGVVRAFADCVTPAIPDNSELIVINHRTLRENLANLPAWLRERMNSEIEKSYARADRQTRGYIGPGVDGLQTYYPGVPSDELFGPNPMSQMSVIDLKVSYDECFSLSPSIEKTQDIDAANRTAIAGLNLNEPGMEWKGGIGDGWWTNVSPYESVAFLPIPRLEIATGLFDYFLKLPKFEPSEFKALDVAAWNNKQLKNLPDWLLATLPAKGISQSQEQKVVRP